MTDAARDAEVAYLREEVDRLSDDVTRIMSLLTAVPGHAPAPRVVYETKNPPPVKVFEFVVYPERTQ